MALTLRMDLMILKSIIKLSIKSHYSARAILDLALYLRRSIMPIDLVCKVEVAEVTAQFKTEYKGKT